MADKKNRKIILASKSPRRDELLKRIGLHFEVKTSDFDESSVNAHSPVEHVEILSRGKAKSVAEEHKDAIVIGADTVIVIDGEIIGKPTSEENAVEILKRLSGKSHLVVTGFTIIDTQFNQTSTKTVESKVYFKELNEAEIEAYVKTGEPMDKAGGYGMQDKAGIFIQNVEGDFFNVVGLPIFALCEELKHYGVNVIDNWNKPQKITDLLLQNTLLS